MCWVAVDRAIAPRRAPAGAATGRRAGQAARDEIAASIRAEGWNDAADAYTQAFGSEDLDASALMLAIVGFLPADDPG